MKDFILEGTQIVWFFTGGELTPFEVTFQSNKVMENLSLPSYSYCITGISKPADYME